MDDHDPILAAPEKIAAGVAILNEWRLANTQPVHEDPRSVKSRGIKSADTIHAHVAAARNTRNAAA